MRAAFSQLDEIPLLVTNVISLSGTFLCAYKNEYVETRQNKAVQCANIEKTTLESRKAWAQVGLPHPTGLCFEEKHDCRPEYETKRLVKRIFYAV